MVNVARQRVAIAVIGFAALCVVGYFVAPYAPIEALLVSSLCLAISTPILVGAILLLRRAGGFGALLQVAGSAALFLVSLFQLFTSLIAHYGFRVGLGDPIVLLRSVETAAEVPMNILWFLTLLFPLGFLWYTLGVKRQTI